MNNDFKMLCVLRLLWTAMRFQIRSEKWIITYCTTCNQCNIRVMIKRPSDLDFSRWAPHPNIFFWKSLYFFDELGFKTVIYPMKCPYIQNTLKTQILIKILSESQIPGLKQIKIIKYNPFRWFSSVLIVKMTIYHQKSFSCESQCHAPVRAHQNGSNYVKI